MPLLSTLAGVGCEAACIALLPLFTAHTRSVGGLGIYQKELSWAPLVSYKSVLFPSEVVKGRM
jgi:hypothetical protein